jgi:RNA polymerase sigma factor (sigma-70 family)
MSEAVATGGRSPGAGIARGLPDDRLARRAAGGDERAFAAIFDRYHQRLYRYCAAIVGDPQDAQDALQNTMVKVLRALPGEERRIELKPWLYRIAHNESIDLLRRRRETRELDAELPAPGQGLAGEAASRERLRLLIADLDELPERQRGALVMRELAGLQFAEIGTAFGTSAAVARQTLYEARLALRQMDEGREMSCEAVTRALSDGDGRVSRRRDLRAHLRICADCRRFREEIEGRERDFAALGPLPALAAAGLLQGLLGGGGGGAGLAAGLGGGAAKSIGATAVLKGAATVAVVAAIGVGAADRGGLVDIGLPGDGGSPAAPALRPAGDSSGLGSDGVTDAAAVGAQGVGTGSRAVRNRKVRDAAVAAPGGASSPDVGSHPGEASPYTPAAPASRSAGSTVHPHGRGHEKYHPSASAHGQETAATHNAAGQGSAGPASHPAHPSHPAKPAHLPTPRTEKGSAASAPAPTAPTPAAQHGQAAPAPEPAEAPAADETGKKP